MRKKLVIISGIVLLVCIGGFLGTDYISRLLCTKPGVMCERVTTESIVIQKGQIKKDYYIYKGKTGKTAYDILMRDEHAWIGAQSGFVTEINFRKADPKKKEYWAFYVNGKLAQVGAWDYVTTNGEVIEWKIEKY